MKAIETKYNGVTFRSRIEARWALFFDALHIPWRYEHEGFELESGRYLPDFWLPDVGDGTWLEVKGQHPTESEMQLCAELCLHTKRDVAVAVNGFANVFFLSLDEARLKNSQEFWNDLIRSWLRNWMASMSQEAFHPLIDTAVMNVATGTILRAAIRTAESHRFWNPTRPEAQR